MPELDAALEALEKAQYDQELSTSLVPATVKVYGKLRKNDADIAKVTQGLSEDDVVQNCVTDLNFLSRFLLPEVFDLDWPPALVAVWSLMVQSIAALQEYRGDANLALGIPRGFAKTTLMKIFCVFAILFTRHTFIVVVGNVGANAEKIIKDIVDMLDTQQVRMFFGHYDVDMEIDRQDEKIFKLCGKTVILKAKGGRTSLRGINIEQRRPDIILMDDVQDEENAKSPIESAALLHWIINTLLPVKSVNGALNLFIGNTYEHEGSVLTKLAEDSEWVSMILGALLNDGTSLWPELHPVRKLLSGYRSAKRLGQEGGWLAQYMNVMDISKNESFNPDAIRSHYAAFEDKLPSVDMRLEDMQAAYVIIDPASTKVQADEHAVGLVFVYGDKPVMRLIIQERMTPTQAMAAAFKLMLRYNVFALFIEDVAYQDTLIFWFKQALKHLRLPIRVKELFKILPISPGRTSKVSRILYAFGEMSRGELLIHPEALPAVKAEGVSFDKLRSDNRDNALDVCHYAPIVWAKHNGMLRHLHEDVVYAAATKRQTERLNAALPVAQNQGAAGAL